MAATTIGETKRKRLLRDILRRRVAPERAMATEMQAWLEKTKTAILTRLRRGADFRDLLQQQDEDSFRRYLRRGLLRAAYLGRQWEQNWIELNGRGKIRQQKAKGGDGQDFERLIFVEMRPEAIRKLQDWLDDREVGIWSKVSETMRRKLSEELRKSIVEGDALPERMKRVQDVLGVSKTQARRIARTETVAGMNSGQQVARFNAGIEHKEWVSTIDNRTRPGKSKSRFNHLRPDGQIQLNENPFIVSGEKLLFPGDISLGASGGNVIQCRCASVAAFPDDPSQVGVLEPRAADYGFDDEDAPEPEIKLPPKVVKPKATKPIVVTPPPVVKAPEPPGPPWREGRDKPRVQKRVAIINRGPTAEDDLPITKERIQGYRSRMEFMRDKLEAVRKAVLDAGGPQQAEAEALRLQVQAVRQRMLEPGKYNDNRQEYLVATEKLRQLVLKQKQAAFEVLYLKPEDRVKLAVETKFPAAKQAGEWLQKMMAKVHGLNPKVGSGTDAVKAQAVGGARRAYYGRGSAVHGSRSTTVDTWAHELGHAVEELGEIHELAKGFLHSRCQGESPTSLRKLFKGSGYRADEYGREDKWQWMATLKGNASSSWYVGKHYDEFTEVISMGVEILYTDPVGFATADPEYFRFIIGVLHGDLL